MSKLTIYVGKVCERTKAMATGTMGHRMLTQLEIMLLLLKEIFKNLKG